MTHLSREKFSVTQRKKLEQHYRTYKRVAQLPEGLDLNFRRAISRKGANLRGLQAAGGNFNQTTLIGANLLDADLTGEASLRHVNWSHSCLANAQMSEVIATKSKFEWCIFRGANLSEADLTGSWFTGSDLTGCDLRGTNLSRTSLWDACLRDAQINEETKFAGARITKITYDLSGWGPLELKNYYERGLVIKDLEDFPNEVWQTLFGTSNLSLAHIRVKRLFSKDIEPLVLAFSGLCTNNLEQPIKIEHFPYGEWKQIKKTKKEQEEVGYVFLLQSQSLEGLDPIINLLEKPDNDFFKERLQKMLPVIQLKDQLQITDDDHEKQVEQSNLIKNTFCIIARHMSPTLGNVEVALWKMPEKRLINARPQIRLKSLLKEVFNKEELLDFLYQFNWWDKVESNIHQDGTKNQLIGEILPILERHGLIGPDFFHKLRAERPYKCTEVENIAYQFHIKQENEKN